MTRALTAAYSEDEAGMGRHQGKTNHRRRLPIDAVNPEESVDAFVESAASSFGSRRRVLHILIEKYARSSARIIWLRSAKAPQSKRMKLEKVD